jgi:hypothetical protein
VSLLHSEMPSPSTRWPLHDTLSQKLQTIAQPRVVTSLHCAHPKISTPGE